MAKSSAENGVRFETVGGLRRIIPKIEDESVRRAVGEDLAYCLLDVVNEYVPENTGALKRAGYKIDFGLVGHKVYSKLSYNNNKLPYVLYQYYGVVYGPNFATFEDEKFNPKDLRRRPMAIPKHTGWASPKPKRPQKGSLGHPEKNEIVLDDGRIIHITGYTGNKNAQHKWLEYVRTTPTIWYPLRQDMIRFIEAVYGGYIGNDPNCQLYANEEVAKWHGRKLDFAKWTKIRAEKRDINYQFFKETKGK